MSPEGPSGWCVPVGRRSPTPSIARRPTPRPGADTAIFQGYSRSWTGSKLCSARHAKRVEGEAGPEQPCFIRRVCCATPMLALRWILAPVVLMLAMLATLATEQASAACQLQWVSDFGTGGGHLVYVCDDPSAPTGGGGSAAGDGGKRPTHAAIVVSIPTLNDGDPNNEFSGAFAAGYRKQAKAIRKAKGACRREFGGPCKKFATARNGWAALVVTLTAGGDLRPFGGSAKERGPAFREATRKARRAFGGDPPNPIARVRAVRSKTARRR
jgi:hypothetical protein